MDSKPAILQVGPRLLMIELSRAKFDVSAERLSRKVSHLGLGALKTGLTDLDRATRDKFANLLFLFSCNSGLLKSSFHSQNPKLSLA